MHIYGRKEGGEGRIQRKLSFVFMYIYSKIDENTRVYIQLNLHVNISKDIHTDRQI